MTRWYLALFIGIVSTGMALAQGSVFPGDANANGRVDHYDILSIGYAYGAVGPSRIMAGSATDLPQPEGIAQDWTSSFPDGLSVIHADANGNGLVEFSDVLVVHQHYGAEYGTFQPLDFPPGQSTTDATFVLNEDHVVPPLLGGGVVTFPIRLSGDVAQTPVNGLAFSIFYHPSHFAAVSFAFGETAFREGNGDIEYIHSEPGRIDVVMTRFGIDPVVLEDEPVGTMSLIIIDDLIGLLPSAPDTMDSPVVIDNVQLIDTSLLPQPVIIDSLTLKLYRSGNVSGTGDLPWPDALHAHIFPNPTTSAVRATAEYPFTKAMLTSPDGRTEVLYEGPPITHGQFRREGIRPGQYWLRLVGDRGVSCQSVIWQDP